MKVDILNHGLTVKQLSRYCAVKVYACQVSVSCVTNSSLTLKWKVFLALWRYTPLKLNTNEDVYCNTMTWRLSRGKTSSILGYVLTFGVVYWPWPK